MMQAHGAADSPIEAIDDEAPGCGGCLLWLFRQLVLLVLMVAAVVAGIRLASPVVEPCPLDAPPIPEIEEWRTAPELYRNACVGVQGVVTGREIGGDLIVETDRVDYTLQVRLRGSGEAFEQIAVGEVISTSGRIRRHDDGGYYVHHGVDRGWWGNLREHLEGVLPAE
ncbi:MAG: hypothetical protein F4X26_10400 [Chloroflexi bacterium]|nr:hypothetical protein [Chloroflexota bacterium]